jgi:hypothetical protein
MEQILIISLISATGFLGAGVGVDWARRELTKKRKSYRMGQALRRGIANPDGIRARILPVVKWQACESISARWS